jgi:outer membrane putative beta-barrel porin/alpha-amylase
MLPSAARRPVRSSDSFVNARILVVTALVWAAAPIVSAQDLFEIQVYPYETVEPGRTMVELHTNYFPSGTTEAAPGEFPENHQSHVTIEVTHGFTKYFECAGYLVMAAHVPNEGGRFAGARIRPRFRLPETPNLFFNISISFELGFNQSEFEANTRTLEIRPIFEHAQGRFYLSINPDLSKALKGPDSDEGPEFEPGVKASWNVTKTIAAGVEYYGATGDITNFEPRSQQHHMIFPTVDLDVSPDWELNFAVGRGLTGTSEHWVVKSIVGYKFR